MSVLGQIATALKTDLADTYRASVDPVFSRQLTENKFRDKRDDKIRNQLLEDRVTARRQKLEDTAKAETNKLGLLSVEKLFDAALESGDFGGGLNTINKSNLPKELKEYGTTIFTGRTKKSSEQLSLEHKWLQEETDNNLKSDQFDFKKEEYRTSKQQWKAEQALREQKQNLLKLDSDRKQLFEKNDVYGIKSFFTNLPNNEGHPFITAMGEEGSYANAKDQLNKYYNIKRNIFNENNKTVRAKIKASNEGVMNDTQSAPTKNDVVINKQFTDSYIDNIIDNKTNDVREEKSNKLNDVFNDNSEGKDNRAKLALTVSGFVKSWQKEKKNRQATPEIIKAFTEVVLDSMKETGAIMPWNPSYKLDIEKANEKVRKMLLDKALSEY